MEKEITLTACKKCKRGYPYRKLTNGLCEECRKGWKKKVSTLIKEGLYEEVTDDKGTRVFGYVNCSKKVMKEIDTLISKEVERARREERSKILEKLERETLPYFRMELWVGGEKFACQSFIDFREIKDVYYKDMVIEKIRRDFEKMIRATDEYLLSKLKGEK